MKLGMICSVHAMTCHDIMSHYKLFYRDVCYFLLFSYFQDLRYGQRRENIQGRSGTCKSTADITPMQAIIICMYSSTLASYFENTR